MTGAIRGPIAITHLRSAGSRKACRVRGGAEGFIGGILEKKVAPVGAREGFDYLMGLRDLVREETACSLPGVFIKFEVFMPLLRKAQSQGYVRDADAIFVESGLRSGFNVGVERSCLKGKRVFRNYPPAVAARAQITVAMNKRLEKGRTVKLGRWEDVRARLDAATDNYFVFPMGAAEKGSNPDPKAPKVMRPTSDHTRTGLNAATVMEELRHSLNTYKEVAWLLKQNYFMYVADVEDAFLLIPLAPWLWFFFLFRYYATDADRHETTAVHIAGDFGAAGMPGTFKRFFVDVVVQMARSALVLTVPMPVYVDDCGAIDESSERLNAEIPAFQDWLWKFCGVGFKRAKDRRAAIPQLMIGFVWDSRSLTRSLEETKLFAYLAVLEEAAGQRSLSLQQRQSLAGKMQRAIMTMPPMAACLLANVYVSGILPMCVLIPKIQRLREIASHSATGDPPTPPRAWYAHRAHPTPTQRRKTGPHRSRSPATRSVPGATPPFRFRHPQGPRSVSLRGELWWPPDAGPALPAPATPPVGPAGPV